MILLTDAFHFHHETNTPDPVIIQYVNSENTTPFVHVIYFDLATSDESLHHSHKISFDNVGTMC